MDADLYSIMDMKALAVVEIPEEIIPAQLQSIIFMDISTVPQAFIPKVKKTPRFKMIGKAKKIEDKIKEKLIAICKEGKFIQLKMVDITPGELDKPIVYKAGTNYRLKGVVDVKKGAPVKIIVAKGVSVYGSEKARFKLNGNGSISAKGTLVNKIYFNKIRVTQDLGGSLVAEHAIFDECSFGKEGGWFSFYSTRWTFSDCVFYNCSIDRLNAVDYGFKFERCVFVSTNLPEIIYPHPDLNKKGPNDKVEKFDHVKVLSNEWCTINNCTFISSRISPTVAWASKQCGFVRCEFLPGETFESPKDVVFVIGAVYVVGEGPDAVWNSCQPEKGKPKAKISKFIPKIQIWQGQQKNYPISYFQDNAELKFLF